MAVWSSAPEPFSFEDRGCLPFFEALGFDDLDLGDLAPAEGDLLTGFPFFFLPTFVDPEADEADMDIGLLGLDLADGEPWREEEPLAREPKLEFIFRRVVAAEREGDDMREGGGVAEQCRVWF